MASPLSKVSKFLASPQGKKLIATAKKQAKDPRNRERIEQFRQRLASKRRPSGH